MFLHFFRSLFGVVCREESRRTRKTKFSISVGKKYSKFSMHKHFKAIVIFFALAGEKGIEISVCFEALDANFWWPLRDVIPRIKVRTFSRPTEVC